MKTVGSRIKERRIQLGLSADDLAAKLGKNRATIYRYESDEIENFSVTIIDPLAKALETTPAYLMGWESETPAPSKDSEHAEVLTPDEQQLLTSYRELSPQGKEYILQTLDMASKVYIKPDCLPEMATDNG